jgi:hypothetical protein
MRNLLIMMPVIAATVFNHAQARDASEIYREMILDGAPANNDTLREANFTAFCSNLSHAEAATMNPETAERCLPVLVSAEKRVERKVRALRAYTCKLDPGGPECK